MFYYTMMPKDGVQSLCEACLWDPTLAHGHASPEILSPSTCIIIQTSMKMKTLLNIIGVILLLAGGTFFLQGINILPGSYMTGDPQWAINGGIMIIIGLGLIVWANWRR